MSAPFSAPRYTRQLRRIGAGTMIAAAYEATYWRSSLRAFGALDTREGAAKTTSWQSDTLQHSSTPLTAKEAD